MIRAIFDTNDGVNIDEEFAANVSLYPNPITDNAVIELDNMGEEVIVEVYNMMGQRVSANNYGAVNRIDLNASTLSAGVYTVKVIAGDHIANKKVTVK